VKKKKNDKDNLIFKASSADSKKLSYQDILNISKGETVVSYRK
jgi:hypothetical protein